MLKGQLSAYLFPTIASGPPACYRFLILINGLLLDGLRVNIDLYYLFIVLEEYLTLAPASLVREQVDVMSDVMKDPSKPRPAGESLLGQMMKEYDEEAVLLSLS